jgi:Na+/H+ antiporter NhaD/arsenite permease-like protein
MQIIANVLLPAFVNLLTPLLAVMFMLRGRSVQIMASDLRNDQDAISATERNLIFFIGLGVLMAVPLIKTLTHLPPFMCVLFGLGILWLAADLLHKNKDDYDKKPLTLVHALAHIDMASLVFFIGILFAVATLEHSHLLRALANGLEASVGRQDLIVLLIGFASSVVDNVPLVAAAMGMYSLEQYPPNSFFWEFLAYSTGTGGSILIIGSAAGIAAMGLEKIAFGWYLKNISALALAGYLAGALVYIVQFRLLH